MLIIIAKNRVDFQSIKSNSNFYANEIMYVYIAQQAHTIVQHFNRLLSCTTKMAKNVVQNKKI